MRKLHAARYGCQVMPNWLISLPRLARRVLADDMDGASLRQEGKVESAVRIHTEMPVNYVCERSARVLFLNLLPGWSCPPRPPSRSADAAV